MKWIRGIRARKCRVVYWPRQLFGSKQFTISVVISDYLGFDSCKPSVGIEVMKIYDLNIFYFKSELLGGGISMAKTVAKTEALATVAVDALEKSRRCFQTLCVSAGPLKPLGEK